MRRPLWGGAQPSGQAGVPQTAWGASLRPSFLLCPSSCPGHPWLPSLGPRICQFPLVSILSPRPPIAAESLVSGTVVALSPWGPSSSYSCTSLNLAPAATTTWQHGCKTAFLHPLSITFTLFDHLIPSLVHPSRTPHSPQPPS